MRLPRESWEALLTARLERPVELTFGRSRTAPVQASLEPARAKVRLHRFFLDAPGEIREALAAWMRAGRRARRASRLLDAWIDARLEELAPPPPRRTRLRPVGIAYDLDALAAPLLRGSFLLDFEQRPAPALGWGRRVPSRARRSLQLGSYDATTRTVRIHPVLDRKTVPEWFVRYVLFHEILHAALEEERGRHGPAFRAREREYPDYSRAVAWQRRHLPGLLRAARRIRPWPGA